MQTLEKRKETQRNTILIVALSLLVMAGAMLPDLAHAGAAVGGPLDDVYTTLTSWTQGSVGKVITLAIFVVGVTAGIVRQSLMAFAVGVGGGLGLYNAPVIVDTIFSAVLK